MCVFVYSQSFLTLCDPMDCSPPGSSFPWSFPGNNTKVGLSFPTPGDLSDPGIEPTFLALAGGFFTTAPPEKPLTRCKAAQDVPSLRGSCPAMGEVLI